MCNPDYRPRAESRSFAAGGKTVKVDRVEWLYIPDPATAQVGLVAGEVDYCESPPTDLPPLMQNNSNLKIAMIDPLDTQGIMPPESSASASQPQRVAYDIVPYVNYGQWFSPTAYRSNLKGVIIFPVPFLPCWCGTRLKTRPCPFIFGLTTHADGLRDLNLDDFSHKTGSRLDL